MGIFQFEKREITDYIRHELETLEKFKDPLNFVIKLLIKSKNVLKIASLDNINLNKVKEKEGKDYYWSVFIYENITLLVRRYNTHLTIFTKVKRDLKSEYGAFTFNVDFDKFGEDRDEISEKYYDKPFIGLNEIIVGLLNLLNERSVHWVWNSASLQRPKYVEIKLIFSDNEISSIDNFAFCMEELSNIYLSLFAETTMLEKIKEYEGKIGENLSKRYKIGKVITKVKDNYYHGVGITLIDTMGKNKESFQDVYSLTSWYFDDIFKD